MRRNLLLLSVLCLLAAASSGAWQEAGGVIEDRIVAVVNEDPILASDLERVIGLGLVDASGVDEAAMRRRVLDQMIDERLRYHELDRFGFTEVPLDEVEEQLTALRERFGGGEALARRLADLEMDEQDVRQLLARQLMVLTYVEERLGPRVFVDLDQIQAYYQETLVPEMRSRGEGVPPLPQVRERIREVLKAKLLNEELERWTEALRREADIEDYLESASAAPPERLLHAAGEPG